MIVALSTLLLLLSSVASVSAATNPWNLQLDGNTTVSGISAGGFMAAQMAIAFALALPERKHPVRSTTFGALERLAANVVRESPDVYFEIQSRNPHSFAALERLRAAVDRVMHAVAAGDAQAFAALMRDGQSRAGGDSPAA